MPDEHLVSLMFGFSCILSVSGVSNTFGLSFLSNACTTQQLLIDSNTSREFHQTHLLSLSSIANVNNLKQYNICALQIENNIFIVLFQKTRQRVFFYLKVPLKYK